MPRTASHLAHLVDLHCRARGSPQPDAQFHGGYALADDTKCAVHVVCRGELIEFVVTAGRVSAAPPDTDHADPHDDDHDDWNFLPWIEPVQALAATDEHNVVQASHGPTDFERSEVEPDTRLLVLRRWLSVDALDEATFSFVVREQRERAALWQSTFDLESA